MTASARILLTLVVVVGLFRPDAMAAVLKGRGEDAWLIKPGKSIGKLYLGEQQAAVIIQCGNPDTRPAYEGLTAMGRRWLVWRGKSGHELDVYTVRGKDDSAARPEQFVRQVRVESPSFHTSDGIKVGSTLNSIHSKLSEVKIPDRSLRLLDCIEGGIAFEMRQDTLRIWRCSAIVIHPQGRNALGEYLRFRNYE